MSVSEHRALRTDGNVIAGSFFMCLSAAMFATSGAAVKSLVDQIDPVSLVFWRNLLSFLLFVSWLVVAGRLNREIVRTKRLRVHFVRALLTTVALYAYFYAVSQLELAAAVMFLSSGPIFVPILALLLFRFGSSATVWVGVLIAFLGVGFVVNPRLGAFDLSGGVLAGILTGVLSGGVTIAIWSMSDTESPVKQIFYFTFFSMVLSIPTGFWYWHLPGPESYLMLAVLAIATSLAQYFQSVGCSYAPADRINTWSYTSIVFSAVGAYIGWSETLQPHTVIGIVLTLLGAQLASMKRVRPARIRVEHSDG